MTLPMQHPRRVVVTRAGRAAGARISGWALGTRQDDYGILYALTAYQVNVIRRLKKITPGFHGELDGLDTELDAVQAQFGITDLELLTILTTEQLTVTAQMLRAERRLARNGGVDPAPGEDTD